MLYKKITIVPSACRHEGYIDMFYKEQLLWVSQQKLASDESIRVDCPNCGGNKTLSISFSDGSILRNCFKASCYGYLIVDVAQYVYGWLRYKVD